MGNIWSYTKAPYSTANLTTARMSLTENSLPDVLTEAANTSRLLLSSRQRVLLNCILRLDENLTQQQSLLQEPGGQHSSALNGLRKPSPESPKCLTHVPKDDLILLISGLLGSISDEVLCKLKSPTAEVNARTQSELQAVSQSAQPERSYRAETAHPTQSGTKEPYKGKISTLVPSSSMEEASRSDVDSASAQEDIWADACEAISPSCSINALPEDILAQIFVRAAYVTDQEWQPRRVELPSSCQPAGGWAGDSWGNTGGGSADQANNHGWGNNANSGGWNASGNRGGWGDEPKEVKPAPEIWLLALRRVCKDWSPIVDSVAWSEILVQNTNRLDNILQALELRPYLATLITRSITVVPDQSDSWSRTQSFGSDDRKTAEAKVAKVIAAASGLQRLQLNLGIVRNNHSINGASYLTSPLHESLCASSLANLTIHSCIVFADLEVLLLRLPSLTTLVLDGVDSLDGRDDIPAVDHRARLQYVDISSYSGKLGIKQLCWLLRPAVSYLRQLHLGLGRTIPQHLGENGEWLDNEQGFQQAMAHSFTFPAFANLLEQLAPTLEVLNLRSSSGPLIVSDGLSAEPHNGSLDYALSHVKSLKSIKLPWLIAGTGFLRSLAGSPYLASMDMTGTPIMMSARDFMVCIESGMFPKLEEIWLQGFSQSTVSQTWNAKDSRALRICLEEKDIALNVLYAEDGM